MDSYLQNSQTVLKRIWNIVKTHKLKSLVLVIAFVVVGGAFASGKPQTEQAQAVLKQVRTLDISTLQSDGGEIPVVGTLKANEQIDLRPQIGGQVARVLVSLGQEVRTGDVLVELSHADLNAQVAQASASVQSALATLAKMRSGDRIEDVIIAEQNLEQARQQLADMKNGGRPEEVAQAEQSVRSAELAVNDAYTNHRQTVEQNATSLQTALENGSLAIQSAQFQADQILEQNLKTVFDTNNDERFFAIIKDKALETQAIQARRAIEFALEKWRADTANLDASNKEVVLSALKRAEAELRGFVDFLDLTGDALDEAHPSLSYDASAISSAIATVNTARATMKSQIDAAVNNRQTILNQEIANAKALVAAQAKIDSAEAGLNNAKEQLQIVKQGPTQQQVAVQEAAVRQAEQRLLIAKNGARPEDIRLQQAAVAQAQASLALAAANRDKAILRAPISGTVTYLPVEVSDLVSSSQIAVSLANKSGLEVVTFVTEDERAFIEVGNAVTVNDVYEGVVQEIAPALDPVNRKIQVKVSVSSEETTLTLGETVRLRIQKIAPEQSSVLVPLSSVKISADGAALFTVNDAGVLEALSVEAGEVTANKIEIVSVLPEGARIVEDARGLKAGQEVIIAE